MTTIFIATKKHPSKPQKTTRFAIQTIRWMGLIIWNFIPEEMKNVQSLDIFEKTSETPYIL